MFTENPNGSKDKLLSEFSKAADTTSIYKNQFICQIKQKMKFLKDICNSTKLCNTYKFLTYLYT